jgi:hypothetical protein
MSAASDLPPPRPLSFQDLPQDLRRTILFKAAEAVATTDEELIYADDNGDNCSVMCMRGVGWISQVRWTAFDRTKGATSPLSLLLENLFLCTSTPCPSPLEYKGIEHNFFWYLFSLSLINPVC